MADMDPLGGQMARPAAIQCRSLQKHMAVSHWFRLREHQLLFNLRIEKRRALCYNVTLSSEVSSLIGREGLPSGSSPEKANTEKEPLNEHAQNCSYN